MNCRHCIYSEQALRLHPVKSYLVCNNPASDSCGEEVINACHRFLKIGGMKDAYAATDTTIEATDGD